LPDFSKDVNEDVLSQFLANRLKLKVGDAFNTFYERRSKLPNIRRFKIVDFLIWISRIDATYVLGDIRHMQRINKWKADQVGHLKFLMTLTISKR
jgi:lipoprotein-releasing system permease protein